MQGHRIIHFCRRTRPTSRKCAKRSPVLGMRVWISISAASVALCSVGLANAGDTLHELAVACTQWRVIERESGPEDYYEVVHGSPISFIRGRYPPPAKTTVLGYQNPD